MSLTNLNVTSIVLNDLLNLIKQKDTPLILQKTIKSIINVVFFYKVEYKHQKQVSRINLNGCDLYNMKSILKRVFFLIIHNVVKVEVLAVYIKFKKIY